MLRTRCSVPSAQYSALISIQCAVLTTGYWVVEIPTYGKVRFWWKSKKACKKRAKSVQKAINKRSDKLAIINQNTKETIDIVYISINFQAIFSVWDNYQSTEVAYFVLLQCFWCSSKSIHARVFYNGHRIWQLGMLNIRLKKQILPSEYGRVLNLWISVWSKLPFCHSETWCFPKANN